MTPENMADLLRRAIREKVLAPGAQLVQEDLARRFSVSRNPVREALRILAGEGLVIMTPGGKATVRRLTLADLTEIYDLRLALEPGLTSYIVDEVRTRDVGQLREMATTMAKIDSSDDLREWLRLNYDFHLRMYRLAGRPHTESVLASLLAFTQPYSYENVGNLGGLRQASDEHLQMVEALAARDAARLGELFSTHLGTARDRLVQAFEQHSPLTSDDAMDRLIDMS